jgi:nitroreductase
MTDDPAAQDPEAVFAALERARAVRSYVERPVPREIVTRLVQAACAAPSPRNTQPWEFVAVQDPSVRGHLTDALAPRATELESLATDMPDGPQKRMLVAGARLARSVGEAGLIVFVCGWPVQMPPPHDEDEVLLSALFTAAQNLRIAARALGLGSTFTNMHVHAEARIREILGIPEDVRIAATIPVGWPADEQGPVRRRPVADILHWDAW